MQNFYVAAELQEPHVWATLSVEGSRRMCPHAVGGKYRKTSGLKEDTWVWSPQGVVNMHVPERRGVVQFTER